MWLHKYTASAGSSMVLRLLFEISPVACQSIVVALEAGVRRQPAAECNKDRQCSPAQADLKGDGELGAALTHERNGQH